MSKWWKCDLQVATPAWDFRMPAGSTYAFSNPDDKRAFARQYMAVLSKKGIEVVALADHNTGEWIDLMVDVGREFGITVFPGCEVTTGSGADGVHLIILGGVSRTSQDFDRLISSTLGFDGDHPRYFNQGNKSLPAASRRTLHQILDELPEGYLVIAPHALTDNGIASERTVKGDLRWTALHHHRLGAIDVGDGDARNESQSFNSRFRRRELHDFKCLKRLAFVATSDAYSLDDLGRRFTWIRMDVPSIEALRQAFLDFNARIICSGDFRLTHFPNQDPNSIRHAWIADVSLRGTLGNSRTPLNIEFHPGLNVIIGGRGSGKSTVVAALRELYSGHQGLPPRIKAESQSFSDSVFPAAELGSHHRLESSQELQSVSWSRTGNTTSTTTTKTSESYNTIFRVRIVNQKELFERVSSDPSDKTSASRSFLALLDDSLGLARSDTPAPDSWWHRMNDAQATWTDCVRDLQTSLKDTAQLAQVQGRARELLGQIAAFDSEDARGRRDRISTCLEEEQLIVERVAQLEATISSLDALTTSDIPAESVDISGTPESEPTTVAPARSSEYVLIDSSLSLIRETLLVAILKVKEEVDQLLDKWRESADYLTWKGLIESARSDQQVYLNELRARGIDPDGYQALQRDLTLQQTVERRLLDTQASIPAQNQRAADAWDTFRALLDERRELRLGLLEEVAARSESLKFQIQPLADTVGWVQAVRDLLNIRADAFLDDVPQLANWLWSGSTSDRSAQWAIWRDALASGDFSACGSRENASLRTGWLKKLEGLDEAIRLRLAVEFPDDVVTMRFLRDGGDLRNASDWQEITQGSPGQRTAAMLSFMLNHGTEPLVLDQPEDDLDTEWVSQLVVNQLRKSRWTRQIIVITHNANVPVNGDAERVIVLENRDSELRIRTSEIGPHVGPIEANHVRTDIQNIMEGGIEAFEYRERRYSSTNR